MANWLLPNDDPNRTLRFGEPLKNLLLRGKKVRDDVAKRMTIGEAYTPASEYPNHILFGFEPAEEGFQFPMYIVLGSEMVTQSMDPETGELRTVTQTIVVDGTAATATDNSGSYSEVQSIDPNWMIKSVRQAAGLAGDATNGLATRTMPRPMRHYWPPVLSGIYVRPVYTNPSDIYSEVSGYITYPIWKAFGYNGGCKGTLTEMWTKVKPSYTGDPSWPASGSAPYIPEPTKMLPRPISYQGTQGFSISIEACLHPAFVFTDQGFVYREPATDPVMWPGTIILDVDVQPYLGGYLSRYVTLNAPSTLDTGLNLTHVAVSSTSVKVTWDVGGSGTVLDVSTSPDFTRGMLLTGQAVPSSGTLEYTITGMTRGQIYFARLRRSSLTSNIDQFMAEPQSELALYDDATAVTTALAFSSTAVGVANAKTLTLRNNGFLSLESLAASLSGTNSGDFTVGTLPSSVAILGGEEDFTLTFTPSATGSRTASLSLASDDPASPLVIALSGTATDPEINVKYSGTSYADGSTISFGSVNTGSSQDFTLTIENTGTGNLTVALTLVSADNNWSLVAAPGESIAGSASTTFDVRFTPTAAGTITGTLSITNTDRDESPYDLTLSGTGVAVGEIEVRDPLGNILVDAGSSYDFGTVDEAGATTRTKTFTIYNRGAGTLGSVALSKSGTHSADFTLGSVSSSIAAAGSADFTIAFNPSAVGARTATISVASDDADENPFTFDVGGTGGTGPEIQVEQPTPTVIADGGSLAFGDVLTTGGSTAKTFTIRNTGTSDLTVSGCATSGTDAAAFVVSGISLPATVAADSTTTFVVTFNPSSNGTKSALLTVTSNATTVAEQSYTISLSGTGVPDDALVTGQSASTVIGQADMDDQVTTASQSVLPGIVAGSAISSGGKLAVVDTTSHRVLIWNSVPTTNGTAADLVIGQTNFTNTSAGTSSTKLNTPYGVAWNGSDLVVADGGNNRVLIYTAPSSNGQAAAVVIGQTTMTGSSSGVTAAKLYLPVGVFVSSGGKLLVADAFNNRVMIWNTVPITNGVSANVVVGQTLFTTRTAGSTAATMNNPQGVCVGPGGEMLVADVSSNRVLVFSAIPTSNGASASVVIGQSSFGPVSSATTQAGMQSPSNVAVSDAGILAVADSYNHRVLLYYAIPTSSGANADAVLGQANFTSGSEWAGGSASASVLSYPYGLVWDDINLVVAGGKRALIFQPA